MKSRKLLSQRHPLLYFLSVWTRRIHRYSKWYLSSTHYAQSIDKQVFSYRVKKHQSLLIRKLGHSDIQL
jgi:vancomycin resistance protein VanW